MLYILFQIGLQNRLKSQARLIPVTGRDGRRSARATGFEIDHWLGKSIAKKLVFLLTFAVWVRTDKVILAGLTSIKRNQI
jgi:hypothetical protein